MSVKIQKVVLSLVFLCLIISPSAAEPIGEVSRSLEINQQSITSYEKFELTRNFSKGLVFSYEPWVAPNFSGTITDYTLTVNGDEIDTDNYIRKSYDEKTINLTEKGESWEREMKYPGYVECFAEKIGYSPIDSFPFKVCNLWSTNPPLPSVEWTTEVDLSKRYDIRDGTDFSYRNFTLEPYPDRYRINNTTKEFVWCDLQKGDVVIKEPQPGTSETGDKRYIFGPYYFSQEFDYANYTGCDAVKTGGVKTGSMLRLSYGPNAMYKVFFAGAVLLISAILFRAHRTDLSNLEFGSIIAVLVAQQALTQFIGGRPLEPALYDLTILLVLVPIYWLWKDEEVEELT